MASSHQRPDANGDHYCLEEKKYEDIHENKKSAV